MKITIVMGFFLPMPAVGGGATEKSWQRLAESFAGTGHDVTIVSRLWRGHPASETIGRITYLRLKGHDHTSRLWRNLLLDFCWSLRVLSRLPAADIVVVNAVTLPILLGWCRRSAGRLVIMPGRMPKGQLRFYRRVARMLAVSGPVLDRAVVENPGLGPVARLSGYPINWSLLSAPASAARSPGRLTIGFVGRLHHEKGLDLLASAIEKLAEVRDLPPWHVLLCGPSDIALGGGGPGYQQRLYRRFSAVLPSERFLIPPAVFSEQALAQIYGQVDVFCYPSLAGQGETFGVAVAEAMASGAVPVVSGLAVFRDLVIPEQSGLIFDHTAPDAADQLASALARLLRDGALRGRLAEQARALTKVYDYPAFASRLLEDFQALNVRPEK